MGVIAIWRESSIKTRLGMLFLIFYYVVCLNRRSGVFILEKEASHGCLNARRLY